MMEYSNNTWTSMSDLAIMEAIGNYLKQQRLDQNKTQAELAEAAGINRTTLSGIENGEPISLSTLIQLLRALDQLHILNAFKVEPRISPLQLAKLEKEKRQRASKRKGQNPDKESSW
ncbi:MAG: helix-turn-helix domain-containing protein [Flavobacteriaceae bacterium]|nr:helix-turn-helix domain-containing protein [Flavobacteriaceae bacterium]